MKWIMLIAGGLTCTMVLAALAPQTALQSTFGETLPGPLSEVVVRNWGALITLMGALVIYGAWHPRDRPLILTVVGISKLIFIGLILAQGGRYLGTQAGIAIAVDTIVVGLFCLYGLAVRRGLPTS